MGTILAWFPLAAPIALSLVRSIQIRALRIDYLMPAELSPVALLGGMLLWAAIRARSHRGLIGWSLASAISLLAGSMVLAEVTGLASDAAEPTGWRLALVAGLLAAYAVALVVLGASGVSLLRILSKQGRVGDSTAPARG